MRIKDELQDSQFSESELNTFLFNKGTAEEFSHSIGQIAQTAWLENLHSLHNIPVQNGCFQEGRFSFQQQERLISGMSGDA